MYLVSLFEVLEQKVPITLHSKKHLSNENMAKHSQIIPV